MPFASSGAVRQSALKTIAHSTISYIVTKEVTNCVVWSTLSYEAKLRSIEVAG